MNNDEDPMFAMSMYMNKESLYKDKSTYFVKKCEGLEEQLQSAIDREIYLEKTVANLETWKHAVEESLITAHIGTAETFDTARDAVLSLELWNSGVGDFFAKEDAKETLDEARNIILELDAHEGAESWSADLNEQIKDWYAKMIKQDLNHSAIIPVVAPIQQKVRDLEKQLREIIEGPNGE